MAAGRAGGPQIPPRITEEPSNVTVLRNEPVRRHIFFLFLLSNPCKTVDK